MNKVGFVGGGKMAEAIIAELIHSRVLAPRDIAVSDVSEERRRLLVHLSGVTILADNPPLLRLCQVVFLAVKPQNLDAVLREIAGDVTPDHLVISIAAGKRIQSIESLLPSGRVIRVMPNLAAVISEGMSVFTLGTRATAEDRRTAARLLSCLGQVLELPEPHFDAVTALSGSGPAFFAHFMQLVADAGAQLGLPRNDALLLAKQTMLGTALLLTRGKMSPEDLIKAVSSEKGTTVAGMTVLRSSPIAAIVAETLAAAARRSEELSQPQADSWGESSRAPCAR